MLTYHRVNDNHPQDRLSVSSSAFEEQMAELARSGRPVISLPSAVDALRRGAVLPEGALAITFDDGYRDNFAVALPILERYRFPAAFFIATSLIGTDATLDRYRGCCADDAMLDWDQVRELRARGHEIGGHTRRHRELAALPEAERAEEIEGCRHDIADRTGQAPDLFCYPRGSESDAAREAVAAAGFVAAFTVAPGANVPGMNLYALRRTEVSGDDDVQDFRLKLRGGFDGWHRLVQGMRSWRRA